MGERKVAIVTGSATGVGAATALSLARRGYDLVINYTRSEAEAKASTAACEAEGAQALRCRANVAEDGDCRAMVQATLQRFGRIDALVNNAGVTSFAGARNWDAIDASTFQHIVGVNALGAFQMIRACAPELLRAGGSIVNLSSTAGALGVGSSVAYIASKGALNAMTLYFARELAPAVRVNAVCPGLITTRWFVDGLGQEAAEQLRAGYEASVPLARACTAEDVAEAAVWLIDAARTVTGELILLDSGMHLGLSRSMKIAPKPV